MTNIYNLTTYLNNASFVDVLQTCAVAVGLVFFFFLNLMSSFQIDIFKMFKTTLYIYIMIEMI